jgi:alpha-galactosidase
LLHLPVAAQQLAATPPMGWNSWNWFAGKVTDADIRKAADLIVSSGMRDAGYTYVNIDDTWEGKRDATRQHHHQREVPRHEGPRRLRSLQGPQDRHLLLARPADLRAATRAPYGHEEQDAKTYADWGIDYLKYDLCSLRQQHASTRTPNDPAAQDDDDARRLR